MFTLLKLWPVLFVPGAGWAILRILAWPPSRARFDKAVKEKY